MTVETMQTIAPGRSVKATLYPAQNRVEVETMGHVTPEETAAALPALVQLLADKSGLPVRHGGKVYRPTPRPVGREWGQGQ